MAIMYCALCGRPVEARRQIGALTVLFAVFTAGASLLAVPFYAKRCAICKSKALSPTRPDGAPAADSTPTLKKLAELERRLAVAEQELEAAGTELSELRAERDFYKQLLEPGAREKSRPGGE